MKIYDISQELKSCRVYGGDIAPTIIVVKNHEQDGYQLSQLTMCLHNGTHLDAPLHFNRFGESIDSLPLDTFVGVCKVIECNGIINAEVISALPYSCERLLIKGKAIITPAAAIEIQFKNLRLIGVESQSIGGKDFVQVHKLLSAKQIAILEGAVLEGVPIGTYLLCAQPLNIAGAEGAPCRAVLIDLEKM